ncbi:MAG: alginate lyase family protein [Desulfomonilaceae bacterium]|nr:alginate lyase family protein [Desulfomonilaceae bacterium]
MNIDKARYLFRRVQGLKPSEPYYRAASKVRHWLENRRLDANTPQRVEAQWEAHGLNRILRRGGGDPVAAVERALTERLPGGWWHANSFWETFEKLYPVAAKDLTDRGEAVVAGCVKVFHWKELNVPHTASWSETFEPSGEGLRWPGGHHSTIEFLHDPAAPERDVKWCWEVNRFQHLLVLGAAWRITGDERFPHTARVHLESWMDRVPYKAGVQWASNLEVGLRLLSWIRCHILCMGSGAWDKDFTCRFIQWVYLHADHLERELTVHHTEGNHLLGEAAALFQAAALYPLFSESDRRRGRALKILNRLVPRLILSDGVYAEQSTGYFRFVCEFLLPLIHLARGQGINVSESVSDRVAAGLEFIGSLPPGPRDVPHIGDSDTGLAIGWQISDYWDFRPLSAAGAVLFDRPSLCRDVDDFPAESFLMLGPEGRKSFCAMAGKTNGSVRRTKGRGLSVFPVGGYVVTRDDRFGIVFDCGSLGIAPGFGHGHADGLSFLISYDGAPVVVDPGTGLYNGPPQWRTYFRSTTAHNTIAVDRGDQSSMLDTFRWSRPLKISREPELEGKDWVLLRGSVRWGGLLHRRHILHLINSGVMVLDSVEGSGTHRLDLSFNLAPGCRVTGQSGPTLSVRCAGGDLDAIVLDAAGSDVAILEGSTRPMGGWHSRYYGLIEPSVMVRMTVTTDLPASFITVFKVPGLSAGLPAEVPRDLPAQGCLDLIDSHRLAAFLAGH